MLRAFWQLGQVHVMEFKRLHMNEAEVLARLSEAMYDKPWRGSRACKPASF